MHSNKYIFMYIIGMSLIVAVVLAFTFSGLKPIHDANEAVFKKRDILSALDSKLETDIANASVEEIQSIFENSMEQVVLDANGNPVEGLKAEDIDMKQEEKKPLEERLYPLFVYKGQEGTYYLTAVRGNGLWDKIWGTIAIEDDFNTIAGVSFDHVTETAGLGAEIKDNANFKKQFIGKTLYKGEDFVSVQVVKGGVKDPAHQVDAIAGATITTNGVSEMLERGLEIYLPYFESQKE